MKKLLVMALAGPLVLTFVAHGFSRASAQGADAGQALPSFADPGISPDGATMPVAADRYTTEYFAAPSPGSNAVAITARANAGSQWWRKGHSHLDESEIWIVNPGVGDGLQAVPRYTQITTGGAKDAWPMWAAG